MDSEHHPVLRRGPFRWVGYSEVRPPYCLVRKESVHSHLVAVVAGEGRALVDGQGVRWLPGQVLLAPVGRHHAFAVAPGKTLTLAWVFFNDRVSAPALPGEGAHIQEADTYDFVHALRLLTREAAGPGSPRVLEALTDVVAVACQRLSGAEFKDPRLWQVWGQVESDLQAPWTVGGMARLARLSEEHWRRLCQRSFQRSPAEHLTWLRMRRAASLLRASDATLEVVAAAVGYHSPYAFNVAFKRWSGQSPGRYRSG